MSYETSIIINAGVGEIWSVLTDINGWARWNASVTSARRLDAGPLAVGSRASIKQPRLPLATWKVTELEPGTLFNWVSESPGVRTLAGHHLIANPDGTVKVVNSIRQSGPLAPLIGLFTSGLIRRYLDMETTGLKRYAETG
jgi:hypothetical protein